MLVPRLEGAPRDDVDSDTEKLFKILEQADVIKKRGALLKIHEQVEVTAGVGLSPGDRAEYCDPISPALACNTEDLCAASAQPLQRQHIIDHHSRVSPHDPLDANCAWPGSVGSTATVEQQALEGGGAVVSVANFAEPDHGSYSAELDEQVRRKGVRPVVSADELRADIFGSDAELDEFLADLKTYRHQHIV